MKIFLEIKTANPHPFAVLTESDDPSVRMNEVYEFKPMEGILTEDSYDELEIYRDSIKKPVIPKGTMVTVDRYWRNFYGGYFIVRHDGREYEVRSMKVMLKP